MCSISIQKIIKNQSPEDKKKSMLNKMNKQPTFSCVPKVQVTTQPKKYKQ